MLFRSQIKSSNYTLLTDAVTRSGLKAQFLAYPETTDFPSPNLLAWAFRQVDSPEMLHTILKSEPFNIEKICKNLKFGLSIGVVT